MLYYLEEATLSLEGSKGVILEIRVFKKELTLKNNVKNTFFTMEKN